jgi:hypothetical protein
MSDSSQLPPLFSGRIDEPVSAQHIHEDIALTPPDVLSDTFTQRTNTSPPFQAMMSALTGETYLKSLTDEERGVVSDTDLQQCLSQKQADLKTGTIFALAAPFPFEQPHGAD